MAEPAQLAIRRDFPRPGADEIAPFQTAPTGWVVDAQGRRGALPHWIRPLSRQNRFVGTALTVRTRPVDNLAPYAALKFAKPGDVLVVAVDGSTTTSIIGDILLGMAKNAGIVACVTDGLVRDIEGINQVGIPIFAQGLSPNSPFKDGPGEIGGTISLGDVMIGAGDLLVGDIDGIVVVPRTRCAHRRRRAQNHRRQGSQDGAGGEIRREISGLARRHPEVRPRPHRRLSPLVPSPPRVLYLSHASDDVYALVREAAGSQFEVVTLEHDDEKERCSKISECDAVICAATPLRKHHLDAAKSLRVVHHQGVGWQDTTDWQEIKRRGLPLALTPEGTTIGVAEHTVLLMLAAGKRLSYADAELRRGRWHVNALRAVSRELSGKTIGYIGFGRIGQAVAERLKIFRLLRDL